MSKERPEFPEPKPITLNIWKTALLVLDLDERCADPGHHSSKIALAVIRFLDRARSAGILIAFTTLRAGEPFSGGITTGKVYSGLRRRPSEAVVFPGGFNKFGGGELQKLLDVYHIDTLIMTGSRSNICVLYTATEAVRSLKYDVVIPIDGVIAKTDYEQDYFFVQLTVLPRCPGRVLFTKFDLISFEGAY